MCCFCYILFWCMVITKSNWNKTGWKKKIIYRRIRPKARSIMGPHCGMRVFFFIPVFVEYNFKEIGTLSLIPEWKPKLCCCNHQNTKIYWNIIFINSPTWQIYGKFKSFTIHHRHSLFFVWLIWFLYPIPTIIGLPNRKFC